MPKVEKELEDSRQVLQTERVARVSAEQCAAVLAAKLDAEITAHKKMAEENTTLTQHLEDSLQKLSETREALTGEVRIRVQLGHFIFKTGYNPHCV